VILGALENDEREGVRQFLKALGAPVLAESLSGLREDTELESLRLSEVGPVLASETGYQVDGVLRIGGVPTLRSWRDLEDRFAQLRVFSVSRHPWKGLARSSELALGDVSRLLSSVRVERVRSDFARELDRDRERSQKRLALLEKYPRSEPGMVHAFSRALPAETSLFLGNSLPIREWDLAASSEPKAITARATRGLNGIDGQVSTFIGLCREYQPNWALLGDLTALYDLAGPWALSQRPEISSMHIAILNNSGGMIFDRMFKNADFLNRHELNFEGFGKMWNLPYQRLTEVPSRLPAQGKGLWEFVPDAGETSAFWSELK
jgi:2-succinyl-5-enolpyruvyl-6-hydroxy-3-cyclohexene-1-carboxylate synthase